MKNLQNYNLDLYSDYKQIKKGIVYLICDSCNDTYKIGVTRDLHSKRIKKLQTGNSTELFMITFYETDYPFKLEKMLHNKYKLKKEINEWFKLDCDDIVNFKRTCTELENTIQVLLENPFYN